MLSREKVSDLVGKPFEQTKNGYAWGCLAPMYEILPEMLHLRYPVSESSNMLQHFKETCQEVSLKDVKYGDILVVKLPMNQWHLMVCLGNGKAIHCTGSINTEIVNYDKYKSRVKGVFRFVKGV